MKICECAGAIRHPADHDRLRCETCAGWIPVGRHPSPDTIRHATRSVRALLNALDENYRWAYNTVYTPTVGEHVGTRTGISNPTLGLVTDDLRRRARAHLTISARLFERATSTLTDTVGALNDALALTNVGASDEHTPVGRVREDRHRPSEVERAVASGRAGRPAELQVLESQRSVTQR